MEATDSSRKSPIYYKGRRFIMEVSDSSRRSPMIAYIWIRYAAFRLGRRKGEGMYTIVRLLCHYFYSISCINMMTGQKITKSLFRLNLDQDTTKLFLTN